MLTADNVTVYGGEVDSLQETGQQQLVSNKLYVSHFYSSLLNCTKKGMEWYPSCFHSTIAPIGGYISKSSHSQSL